MAKVKTSKKQRSSSKKSRAVVLHPHKVMDESVLDRETLKSVLMEALIDGDIETLKDVLITQIRLANKAELVRKSKLGHLRIDSSHRGITRKTSCAAGVRGCLPGGESITRGIGVKALSSNLNGIAVE